MRKLGLIVNPVAGLGGSVGLKGSDGAHIVEQALALGAQPQAGARAATALSALTSLADRFQVYTCAGPMGETAALAAGLLPADVLPVSAGAELGSTTAADTVAAARALAGLPVDLLLFAGGDGTARNVCQAVGQSLPVIGIPAGVKIHSAVYATNPRNAGQLAAEVIRGQVRQWVDGEVMDIDEEAFRGGRVSARLYGYMKIPLSRSHLQGGKVSSSGDPAAVEGIAATVVQAMEPDVLYLIGPGSTTLPIMTELGLAGTLLGVDVVRNRQLLAADVSQRQILAFLATFPPARILVTPIGGQACLFGRGNQQLGPEVLRRVGKENIRIVATRAKLQSFYGNCLLVDTGDEALDQELCGYSRVIVGYKQETVFRIGC